MKRRYSIIAVMLVIVMALGLLCSCAGKTDTDTNDSALAANQTADSEVQQSDKSGSETEKEDKTDTAQTDTDTAQSGAESDRTSEAEDSKDSDENIDGDTQPGTENEPGQTTGEEQTEQNQQDVQQPEPSNEPEPESEPEPEPVAEPYSVKTADTVLTVTGAGVSRDYYFTLSEIQSLGGVVEDDYFSRGKEPQTATNHYKCISVSHLLSTVGASGKKVTFTASDGYAVSYSISAVSASYIDETVPGKSLQMILAWQEDYAGCGLRLVMGQNVEGEYNRTNWVRNVIEIEVKA